MRIFIWLIRALIFCVLLALALENRQIVTIKFASYSQNAPLILVGLAFFVVGLLIGILAVVPSLLRMRFANRRLKKELHNARLPIQYADTPSIPPIPPIA